METFVVIVRAGQSKKTSCLAVMQQMFIFSIHETTESFSDSVLTISAENFSQLQTV